MLGLKLPTDPRWVNIVEKNINEILTDHAYCEQKAASYAISLITKYPEITEIVDKMIALSQEEMEHFQMELKQMQFMNGIGEMVGEQLVFPHKSLTQMLDCIM